MSQFLILGETLMSSYAWLCDYSSHYVTNVYGMVIQTAEFDGVERFWLERKGELGKLGDAEQKKLEKLQQSSYKFMDSWREREFITNLPIKLFKEIDIDYNNMPSKEDIFFRITNSYLVVSEKLYNILSQFNLGKTHFSKVYIYDIESKEQLSDTPYYFINIAEKRAYLDIENSKGLGISTYNPQLKQRFIGISADDDIKLFNVCLLDNVDLWHEPILDSSLFFSDRLVNALLNAGFTKEQLGLIRCMVP